MKKFSIAVAIVLLTATNLWSVWNVLNINEVVFGDAITIFNGNPADASIVVTGKVPNQRTAIDIWPHDGPLPDRHAITEQVWYRTRFVDWPTFERISLSAMAVSEYTPEQYRFSVEQGGVGLHRPIWFCFDGLGAIGTPAYCPLRVTMDGVFACDKKQVCNKIGG